MDGLNPATGALVAGALQSAKQFRAFSGPLHTPSPHEPLPLEAEVVCEGVLGTGFPQAESTNIKILRTKSVRFIRISFLNSLHCINFILPAFNLHVKSM
jgi:hypothetical protein